MAVPPSQTPKGRPTNQNWGIFVGSSPSRARRDSSKRGDHVDTEQHFETRLSGISLKNFWRVASRLSLISHAGCPFLHLHWRQPVFLLLSSLEEWDNSIRSRNFPRFVETRRALELGQEAYRAGRWRAHTHPRIAQGQVYLLHCRIEDR